MDRDRMALGALLLVAVLGALAALQAALGDPGDGIVAALLALVVVQVGRD